MLIAFGATYSNFAANKAFKTCDHARLGFIPLPAICGENHIGLKQIGVFVDKWPQGWRPDLFLALKKEFYIDRQLALGRKHGFRR